MENRGRQRVDLRKVAPVADDQYTIMCDTYKLAAGKSWIPVNALLVVVLLLLFPNVCLLRHTHTLSLSVSLSRMRTHLNPIQCSRVEANYSTLCPWQQGEHGPRMVHSNIISTLQSICTHKIHVHSSFQASPHQRISARGR